VKITYIYPPLFNSFYPIATRMITENLLRDDRLEVAFSDIPVTTYQSGVHKRLYESLMGNGKEHFPANVRRFLRQKYFVNNLFYVFMSHGYYNDHVRPDVESRHVMVTCINFSDLIMVKHLLEKGKKVMMGGPLINISLSSSFIRDLLERMGTPKSSLQNDLVVVSGNIDLSTDLFRILREWKDRAITRNAYGTLYECERDYLQDLYENGSAKAVHFGFNNRCWYGKCRFCTYRGLPTMNFLEDLDGEPVARHIRRLMERFESKELRFIDSYFHADNPRTRAILDQVRDYTVTVYSGIMLLKNVNYIQFINRYVKCLLIGLESASDFTLSHIDKGYLRTDIDTAVDRMIQHLDREVFLEISIILDLPARDREDVADNYEYIARMKERLEGEGFRVGIHMNILSLMPNMEMLFGSGSLFEASENVKDLEQSSTKNFMVGWLKAVGMENPSLLPTRSVLLDRESPKGLEYGYISADVPLLRRDVNGNVLPSDLLLMDEKVMERILERRTKRM
jgi:hypothetical protein